MRFRGFVGSSYKLKSVNVDCQRSVNLYTEINEKGTGKEGEQVSLISAPGKTLFANVGDGPIRGQLYATNGHYFVVSKNKFYRITSEGVETELGTLNSSAGPVSMADNGSIVMITDGEDGYTWTIGSSTFAEIVDPEFLGGGMVSFMDGYFIVVRPNSGQFQISGLNSATWDSSEVTTSEGSPDQIVSSLVNSREIWMFNEKTTEVFFNSGAADFPFERIDGAFVEKGIAAKFSAAKLSGGVYWLGKDEKGSGIVYRARGYQPEPISTNAVNLAIQSYSDISDATAYTYQSNGHEFYVLNFPTANTSWVFDTTTNDWHERVSTNNGNLLRDRGDNHAFAHGKHIVGDFENGNLYELSDTVYTDNDAVLTRMRISPHVTSGMKRIFYNSFELDMEAGTGLDGLGQGTDPKVMMQFSDDGGHTYSNEKWKSFGKIGQRKRRAKWDRLGQSRDRVFKIVITDPVKVVIIGAELDFLQGGN